MGRVSTALIPKASKLSHSSRSGFTLTELLVVIAIIGLLMGLALPAVTSVREAGRNTQCKNNLYQIGRAAMGHIESTGFFPSGGWGWDWVGDPDRGFGRKQPGGWYYSLLPFLDLTTLWSQGAGLADAQKKAKIAEVVQTVQPGAMCPSRRRAIIYPMNKKFVNANATAGSKGAKGDYAINCGDQTYNQFFGGPGSLDTGDKWPDCDSPAGKGKQASSSCWRTTSDHTGISYQRSEISPSMIRDGDTQTLLAGEKYLDPNSYEAGTDGSDNESIFCGYDNDNFRSTYYHAPSRVGRPPQQDRPGFSDTVSFGSPHSGACNFVFCDGHVQPIGYSVDHLLFSRLGNRADDIPVDLTKIP